jgi:DNA-directed RNA polymerase subunit RPC12/RpoP
MVADGTTEAGVESPQVDSITTESGADEIHQLTAAVSAESFEEWRQEREYAENIRNGTAYFNGPGEIKPPERHSPSSLLQCHRKVTYKQLNAPAEQADPDGIFWIGSRVEEDIACPFLQALVSGSDFYVTNSIWIDFTATTEAGDLRIKGETDPVIVDADAKPLILTEIKTKDSVGDLDSPNSHHKAQTHAYMKGLSEKYDRNVTNALIIYIGRTGLDMQVFQIAFDPVFWRRTVLSWAEEHTTYRRQGELPPAQPEQGWECTYCSYRERCGKGDWEYADIGPKGLLPGVTTYPKPKVVDYLEGHDDAKLTPALAIEYPELCDQYEVYDWECRVCGQAFAWDDIEWDSAASTLPRCPDCSETEPIGLLGGPQPANQVGGDDHVDG